MFIYSKYFWKKLMYVKGMIVGYLLMIGDMGL